jgi:hypothetical protein
LLWWNVKKRPVQGGTGKWRKWAFALCERNSLHAQAGMTNAALMALADAAFARAGDDAKAIVDAAKKVAAKITADAHDANAGAM